ncbi:MULTISPECIES: elongation factor P hydroxylase [unclassified Moraxella]|uniref:elongation factor P hydroxylase n=1 Tax=unclassified Moraxella TaxID=2685852 RepID=UPI003AF67EB2
MLAIFPFITLPFNSCLTLVYYHQAENITTPPTLPIRQAYAPPRHATNFANYLWQAVEPLEVDWLIEQFNGWFREKNTILVRGEHEPEYFAPTDDEPAKIVFAHGFFASSLHEISHWCVAGKQRRLLNDFGYWYAPDGRSAEQQSNFEKVEIIPQAIECLLTLSCGKRFLVSQDNLFADFDTSQSTFAHDVREQALHFWQTGEKLPTDATTLLKKLAVLRPLPLNVAEIAKN